MQGSKDRQNNNHFSGANIPSSSSKWIGVHLELPKMEGFSSIRIDLVLLSPLSQVDLYRLVNAAISTRARFSGWEGRQQLQIENTSSSYQPILWTNNAYLRHLRATRVSDKAVIKATPIVPKTLFCWLGGPSSSRPKVKAWSAARTPKSVVNSRKRAVSSPNGANDRFNFKKPIESSQPKAKYTGLWLLS